MLSTTHSTSRVLVLPRVRLFPISPTLYVHPTTSRVRRRFHDGAACATSSERLHEPPWIQPSTAAIGHIYISVASTESKPDLEVMARLECD